MQNPKAASSNENRKRTDANTSASIGAFRIALSVIKTVNAMPILAAKTLGPLSTSFDCIFK